MSAFRDRPGDEPLTDRDLVVATLVGRYVERRERDVTPRIQDLLAVAAEFGENAVGQLRTVLAFYEAMRSGEDAAADGPTRHPRMARPAGVRVGGDRPASGAGHEVQED